METRETITLDARAQQRLYVLNHVLTRGLTVEAVVQVLVRSAAAVRRREPRQMPARGALGGLATLMGLEAGALAA